MISIDKANASHGELAPASGIIFRKREYKTHSSWRLYSARSVTWLCLLLACLATSWYSYQYFLVAQPRVYTPQWHGAQWVGAADGNAPIAYYRHLITLGGVPDSAFVTITASQVFRLYVNNTFINSNGNDFIVGNVQKTYTYSIGYALFAGSNVIGIRVANDDRQPAYVRATVGITKGTTVSYFGTNSTWQATTNTQSVYPFYVKNLQAQAAWRTTSFDAGSWMAAKVISNPPATPNLQVNPQLYSEPDSTHWLTLGPSTDTYYVRSISLPATNNGVWLRISTPGNAEVFINGYSIILWKDQSVLIQENKPISAGTNIARHPVVFAQGIYDISAYVHSGTNILAIHVFSAGVQGAQYRPTTVDTTALSLDTAIADTQNNITILPIDDGWHAAQQAVSGWEQGNAIALAWPHPPLIERAVALRAVYIGSVSTSRSEWQTPDSLLIEVILLSILGVIVVWLLCSVLLVRIATIPLRTALSTASLLYLPALAGEALLLVLDREPQIPSPFPYTTFWGLCLLALVATGFLLIVLHSRSLRGNVVVKALSLSRPLVPQVYGTTRSFLQRMQKFYASLWPELRLHWPVALLVLIAIPMIFYNLAYDSYWQDELTSFSVAQGILAHGIPVFPSGFLYPKAELYSYVLALSQAIFGDHDGTPRIISALEYVISIPLAYFVGCYFFKRRIALLATVMLTFSPIALLWGRQIRMYEQAQLFTLLVVYIFHRAVQERERPYLVYLAMLSLLANYFSHEETFIIMPALAICVLLLSKKPGRLLPEVFYQKHWWFASVIAGAIIGAQLVIVNVSHPPILGTDQSQRPLIQLTTDNIQYYYALLFLPSGRFAWIPINSVLALFGCIWARRSNEPHIKYITLFFVLSLAMLVFVFTFRADRYLVPLIPLYYFIGAWALYGTLEYAWTFIASFSAPMLHYDRRSVQLGGARSLTLPMRIVLTWSMTLLFLSVIIAPMLPLSNYNLFISRTLGFVHHRYYPDYDTIGPYMKQHYRKGDIVISIIPDTVTYYYVGHVDYFLSIDHALFLFEKKSHIVDNYTGAIALLGQHDLQAVLATQERIWLISASNHYQTDAAKHFTFSSDFHIVYEGYDSLIYFRGDPVSTSSPPTAI